MERKMRGQGNRRAMRQAPLFDDETQTIFQLRPIYSLLISFGLKKQKGRAPPLLN